MLLFFLHHLSSLKIRSFGIIFIVITFSCLFFAFLLIYKNTVSAISYYIPNNIDPRRVTFTDETSVFEIFAKNAWGIPQNLVSEIQKDDFFSRTRTFSFVETNVLGWFDIFVFHLDTDIPVFGLVDSHTELAGFGISPSMLHYYNLELAGSHPMFPILDADFLKGKRVSLTFWASKLFPVNTPATSPLVGDIVSIDWDYPGFWVVVPQRLVNEKLKELGINERQPYKIVAYMKDIFSRNQVVQKYKWLNLTFDQDRIEKTDRQFRALLVFLIGLSSFFWGIILLLLILLFLWYFRERNYMMRLVEVYGIWSYYRHFLLYGEVYIFLVLWIIGSYICIFLFQHFPLLSLMRFFREHGVLFPLIALSPLEIFLLIGFSTIILMWVIFFTSRKR